MIKWLTLVLLLLVSSQTKAQSSPCDSTILVPNSMTPNGDSNNDCLRIRFTGKVPIQYEFIIYNRWGEKIFETTNPDSCWDGNKDKTPCPVGTYFWILSYQFSPEDEKHSCSGHVTLLR